jgi:inorganic triphosphatase YgiF
MEIEAKYRVEQPKIFGELLTLKSIGRFQLEPDTSDELQHNTYLDTPSGHFRAQRYGLRVRDLGARRIVTLKGETRVASDVHERDEWEVEIGSADRPEQWPPGEVRDRVLALAAGEELVPILTVQTRRRHIYASYDGRRFAEISLDDGVITAGGREEPFCELEIELLRGSPRSDFDELITLLRKQFTLLPEERSKLARGLALLDRAM